MEIIERKTTYKEDERIGLEIFINGELVFDIMDVEPGEGHDMTFNRMLAPCYRIVDLIVEANRVGLLGEPVILTREDVRKSWDDYWKPLNHG